MRFRHDYPRVITPVFFLIRYDGPFLLRGFTALDSRNCSCCVTVSQAMGMTNKTHLRRRPLLIRVNCVSAQTFPKIFVRPSTHRQRKSSSIELSLAAHSSQATSLDSSGIHSRTMCKRGGGNVLIWCYAIIAKIDGGGTKKDYVSKTLQV
jgi:hypothetical protein